MSTTSEPTASTQVSQADSLLVLQSLLDGLLQWLTPGQEEGRDPANLDPLLDESLNQASNARLYGVSALLRIWSSAMTQRARVEAMLSEAEKAHLHTWFSGLALYCQGALDDSGQEALLDQLAVMPNLAALPPRLHTYLRDRLQETRPYIVTLLAEIAAPSAAPAVAIFLHDQALEISTDCNVDATVWEVRVESDASVAAPSESAFEMPELLAELPSDTELVMSEALANPFSEAALFGEDTAYFEPSGASLTLVFEAAELGFDATGRLDSELTDQTDLIQTGLLQADLKQADPDLDDLDFADQALPDPEMLLLAEEISAGSIADSSALFAEPITPITALNETIWISPEELQLALEAVGGQILPSVSVLAQTDDADERASAMADLEFNLGLVGNAMEMLGTPALSRGILAMQTSAASAEPPDPVDLTNWSAALIAFLEQPNDDNTELLTVFSAIVPELDDDWAVALQSEARRIRFGLDPKLLAQRKTTAEPEDITLQIAADVLPTVREGMLRELPGNAERLGNAIRRLVATGDPTPIEEARRISHTLKGDANTVGISGLANLSHSLEDLLMELYKHPERLVPALGQVLDQAADCVEEIADYVLGRGPEPQDVLSVYQSVIDWSNAVVDDSLPAYEIDKSALAEVASAPASAESTPMAPAIAKEPVDGTDATQARTATLTVSANLLDDLQRLAGETLVMARQIDQRLTLFENMHREQVAEVRNASNLLGKLDDLISLRGAALQSTALRAGSQVDPLELDQYNELHVVSRRLLESNADNNEYQQRLDGLLVELEGLRSQQEAVHADLQRMVQRARTVPFDQISGRLQRIVRQTARQLERQVDLRVSGEQTLLDAELLDRIVEPLGHLLRNAIDHGLEDSDERLAVGKSETGTIQISVTTIADSIEIRVQDDGRGLNYVAIRDKALALGMLTEDRDVDEVELTRMILTPGFTTRREATQVSGRGIGMDVVNQRIIDLRGQLKLESEQGRGLIVSMRLPVSQTMANVIIAHGHGLILGAVAGSVERVHNFSATELDYADDGQITLLIDSERVPVYPVETLYGRGEGRLSLPTVSGLGLVVSSARGKRVLVSVSSIGDVSNVIVKPISPLLPPVPSVRGMTLLGDGRLAAVVDMGTLIDALDADAKGWQLTKLSAEQAPLPRVVIADDSLSVRRALAELMEDAGYEVSTARDGLEALELVNTTAPALVLLDLEMPKLNGLEVTRFMRGRAQTRHVPVVMITSRAGDKYQAQAEEAGVTVMMGKPFSEDELILCVRNLMAQATNPENGHMTDMTPSALETQ